MRTQKRTKGFTLIELVITVAVIAILATVAFPSFVEQMRKSRRADGRAAVLDVQLKLERYRASNNSYAAGDSDTTLTTIGTTNESQDGHYDIVITWPGGAATNYLVTATAKGGQAADTDCPTLSINQDGTKGPAADCW